MADTEASIGWGAEFWLHDGADPGALVELAEVFELTPPDETVDTVEATHYKSPQARREYIAGLIASGTAVVRMNYVAGSATDALIRGAKGSRLRRGYKIVIPDDGDAAWEVSGSVLVTMYARAIPVGDRMTADMTVQFTGAQTEAAPA